jgi:hypothetical protein
MKLIPFTTAEVKINCMKKLTLAGLGTDNLKTLEPEVITNIGKLSYWLATLEHSRPELNMTVTLNTGNSRGAEEAFQAGFVKAIAEGKLSKTALNIYLPYDNYGWTLDTSTAVYHMMYKTELWNEARKLAQRHHKGWASMLAKGRDLGFNAQQYAIRSVFEILGTDLCSPIDAVLCATYYGETVAADCSELTRNCSLQICLAEHFDIPVFNLSTEDWHKKFKNFLNAEGSTK